MSARLEKLGVRYEMVDAVDGRELDLSALGDRLRQDKMRRKNARILMPAEIGCYLSHYNLWKRIADSNIPAAIVLEDDAVFFDDFLRIAAAAANIPYEWDVIHLRPTPKNKKESTLCKIDDSYSVCRMKGKVISTIGYLVSLAGAKKLAEELYEMSDAVDWALATYWHTGIKFYSVSPRIMTHEGLSTHIALPHYKKESRKGRTFLQLLRSKIWKLSQGVRWRLYVFRNPLSREKKTRGDAVAVGKKLQ